MEFQYAIVLLAATILVLLTLIWRYLHSLHRVEEALHSAQAELSSLTALRDLTNGTLTLNTLPDKRAPDLIVRPQRPSDHHANGLRHRALPGNFPAADDTSGSLSPLGPAPDLSQDDPIFTDDLDLELLSPTPQQLRQYHTSTQAAIAFSGPHHGTPAVSPVSISARKVGQLPKEAKNATADSSQPQRDQARPTTEKNSGKKGKKATASAACLQNSPTPNRRSHPRRETYFAAQDVRIKDGTLAPSAAEKSPEEDEWETQFFPIQRVSTTPAVTTNNSTRLNTAYRSPMPPTPKRSPKGIPSLLGDYTYRPTDHFKREHLDRKDKAATTPYPQGARPKVPSKQSTATSAKPRQKVKARQDKPDIPSAPPSSPADPEYLPPAGPSPPSLLSLAQQYPTQSYAELAYFEALRRQAAVPQLPQQYDVNFPPLPHYPQMPQPPPGYPTAPYPTF